MFARTFFLRPLCLVRHYSGKVAHTAATGNIPLSDPAMENNRLRQNLALSYRLLDRFNLNEGTCNHLTVMAPARDGRGEVYLIRKDIGTDPCSSQSLPR